MSNRIEQVIGDIEEYIDGCKMQAFSNTKIIVDRTTIEEYLDELRQYTPEEVKKYQRMLNNRDKILADAKKKAQDIEEQATTYAQHLVSENQITKMAYDKANEILQDAKEQAAEILENASVEAASVRQGALAYTNDMLDDLKLVLAGALEDCRTRFSDTVASLNDHLNIVEQNQHELNGQNNFEAATPEPEQDTFFEEIEEFDEDDE